MIQEIVAEVNDKGRGLRSPAVGRPVPERRDGAPFVARRRAP